MSDGKTRKWKDRSGTEWFVRRREGVRGLKPGWVLRRVGYSLVAYAEAPDDPSGEQLQDWIDSHTKAKGGDPAGTTVRLWTDSRDGTEWEVFEEGGELVFQRGIEAVRAPRGDRWTLPRSMDDSELQDALDRAQSGE